MISVPAHGGCQCNKVRYTVSAMPYVQYTCHCSECQLLTSSAYSVCMQVPAESLSVTEGAPGERTRVAESGNRLTTSFCTRCGSALFASNSARPRLRTIFVGTLDRPGDVDVDAHIWLSRKLPWVEVPTRHRQFEFAGDWRPDYQDAMDRLQSAGGKS